MGVKKWLKAAERYEASKKPGFKAREKKEKLIPTLDQFMTGKEGRAAKKLLASVGGNIVLGESDEIMGQASTVTLDAEGLKCSTQLTGSAAARSKEKPHQKVINAPEALMYLQEFPKKDYLGKGRVPHFLYEEHLVLYIRNELNAIADAAP